MIQNCKIIKKKKRKILEKNNDFQNSNEIHFNDNNNLFNPSQEKLYSTSFLKL
jgi:hypothetical protein